MLLIIVFLVPHASAQAFSSATSHGDDRLAPERFTFSAGRHSCEIDAGGKGRCERASRKDWTFALPVDDGRIRVLYFHADGDGMLLAYELDNGVEGWSEVVRLKAGARSPAWKLFVPAFNLAAPVLHRDRVSVTAGWLVVCLDPKNGKAISQKSRTQEKESNPCAKSS